RRPLQRLDRCAEAGCHRRQVISARLPRAVRILFRPLKPSDAGRIQMPLSELDNPFFSSLRTRHRAWALGDESLCRYPADVAPFLGVASPDAATAAGLAALVPHGDTTLLLGVMPDVLDGWQLDTFRPLAQMVCEQRIAPIDGPEIIALDEHHR